MILLRRVIGDALRARRQGQQRTLREVSTAANVSLGYLSEIERGQKEASSELLAAICEALGAQLSELLGEVSSTLALAEQVDAVSAGEPPAAADGDEVRLPGVVQPSQRATAVDREVATDGNVSVSVRRETPLKATLRTTRRARPTERGRDVVCAA